MGRLLWEFNTEFDADTHRLCDADLRPTSYCDGPLAYLEELHVGPALRDAGTGTRLLHFVFDDARARSCCEMHIGVDAVDTEARRFYERHGFSNLEPDTGTQMLLNLGEVS